MKTRIWLPFFLLIIGCGQEQNEMISTQVSEIDSDESLVVEEDLNNATSDFVPHADVARYANEELNDFGTYQFEGILEFSFPEEPEFKTEEKSDHTLNKISAVFNGSIYAIEIEDYSVVSGEVDASYAVYVHDSYIDFLGGEVESSNELDLGNEVTGKYSVYSYPLNDKTYFVDHVTLRSGDYVVQIDVTSSPKYEATKKVKQFVDAVKFL
jgi:hypothetical protein